jgi:hypothetical protein
MATPDRDEIAGWFAGRLPDGWFTGAPSVTINEGQIVVVGRLSEPVLPADASAQLKAGSEAGRISRFREGTRPQRIGIAREAQARFELNVTWGATAGGTTETFTPGGSGRSQNSDGGEAQKVVIGARGPMARRWQRRFAFGGPRAWRRRGWYVSPSDEQSF